MLRIGGSLTEELIAKLLLDILRPGQNIRHFADGNFELIFFWINIDVFYPNFIDVRLDTEQVTIHQMN